MTNKAQSFEEDIRNREMAFNAMNIGWGEASKIQSIYRKLADAANGANEYHDELTVQYR